MAAESMPEQLVLVLGCPRSGVALVASQLALHPEALLLDGDGLPEAWLRHRLDGGAPDPSLINTAQRALAIIHAGSQPSPPAHCLILPLPHLLSGGSPAADLLTSAPARQLMPRLLEVVRHCDDVVSSLARFPHLPPHLPDPWEQPEAFEAAARNLWCHCRDAANHLRQAGWRVPQIDFAELVNHGPSALWRAAELPLPTASGQRELHGISPSLSFRERRLDRASLGRSQRQRLASGGTETAQHATSAHPSLIVTGRGGSGTRLLTLLLQALEVHLGDSLNPTGDSVEWADLIYELCLDRLSGRPGPWRGSWPEELRHRATYVAPKPIFEPWGWKLPEAMLVLPELLTAWPQTTIIHLVRHPIDTCLRRTHMTSRLNNPIGRATLNAAYRALGRNSDPAADPGYWHNAVSWWYQLQQLQKWREASGSSETQWIELRYEDVCQRPQTAADELAQRLGIPSKPVCLPVSPTRQRRWQIGDPSAQQVWDLCGPIARHYGYNEAGGITGT